MLSVSFRLSLLHVIIHLLFMFASRYRRKGFRTRVIYQHSKEHGHSSVHSVCCSFSRPREGEVAFVNDFKRDRVRNLFEIALVWTFLSFMIGP